MVRGSANGPATPGGGAAGRYGPPVDAAGGADAEPGAGAEVVVVGGGRMGQALAAGLLAAGRPAATLAVVEVDPARRRQLATDLPGVAVAAAAGGVALRPGWGAVLAVKPGDVAAACAAVGAAGAARVLSVAAGVGAAAVAAALPAGTPVLRAMPNTPALIRAGAAGLAAGPHAGDDDLAWAEALLGAVGTVERVPEGLLDAVTALSGSGPAYVFLLAEALIDAGVLVGLGRPTAAALATQTLLGAARMLAETGDAPAELRAAVTSPGGTTAAGLHALEAAAVRAAVADAVVAAARRAGELGRS